MNKLWRKLQAAAGREKQLITGGNGGTSLQAESGGEGESPKVKGIAYNGGKLRVQGWFYPVVVDLQALDVPDKVRMDVDHSPKVIDKIGSVAAEAKDGKLTYSGTMTGKGAAIDNILAHNEAGEDWEVSIDARVMRDKLIETGETVTVNGQEFEGPFILATQSRLVAISVVTQGADGESTLDLAASAAGGKQMFEKWLKAKGFDKESLSDGQIVTLKAAFDAEQSAEECEGENGEGEGVQAAQADDGVVDLQAQADEAVKKVRADTAAELERIDVIKATCAEYDDSVKAETMSDLRGKAIKGEITSEKLELELMKAGSPAVGSHVQGAAAHAPSEKTIEAAAAMTLGLADVEKTYKEPVLEAAHKESRGGYGLQAMIMDLAAMGGYQSRRFRDTELGDVLKAAFSTQHATDIFNNVANKLLLEGFMYVDQSWRSVVGIDRSGNFKPNERHRMGADAKFELVGQDGEIKHGTLSEDKYTTQVQTRAKMFGLTRQNFIDDDLGALNDLRRHIGRGAALALNDTIWAKFNGADSTYESTLTDTDLNFDGLEAAVGAMDNYEDDNGEPLSISPEILLVGSKTPNNLKMTAMKLMQQVALISTKAATSGGEIAPARHPYQGEFAVVATPYLKQTGSAKNTWNMIANPNVWPVVVATFLNGQQTPVIESTDADFNVLGVNMRGYYDFGADAAEPKGGIRVREN